MDHAVTRKTSFPPPPHTTHPTQNAHFLIHFMRYQLSFPPNNNNNLDAWPPREVIATWVEARPTQGRPRSELLRPGSRSFFFLSAPGRRGGENLQIQGFQENSFGLASCFCDFASEPSLNLVRQGHSGAEIRVFHFPAFPETGKKSRAPESKKHVLFSALCPPLGAG